jgi:hypothetical protein
VTVLGAAVASPENLGNLAQEWDVDRTRRLIRSLWVDQVAVLANVNCIFALVDPRLLKVLNRFGICSTRLADDIDYHGPRSPVSFLPIEIFENTYTQEGEMWKIVTDNGRLHEFVRHRCSFL